jgi:hypothetical protein
MAAKKPSPAMDFIVKALQKNNKASYGEINEAAKKKGLKIYPIMYGRAQALLNLVPTSPRGSKKKAAKKKAARRAATTTTRSATSGARRGRPPGRPRAASGDTLESIVDHVRGLEQERDMYRDALERLRDVLENALAR